MTVAWLWAEHLGNDDDSHGSGEPNHDRRIDIMTRSKLKMLIALSVVLSLASSASSLLAESTIENLNVPATLTPQQFADFHTLIKPAVHESPWANISWHASVWEARKQAAAEGKPILIWSGGGSPPLGAC
jgi:hypothetical protein